MCIKSINRRNQSLMSDSLLESICFKSYINPFSLQNLRIFSTLIHENNHDYCYNNSVILFVFWPVISIPNFLAASFMFAQGSKTSTSHLYSLIFSIRVEIKVLRKSGQFFRMLNPLHNSSFGYINVTFYHCLY